MPKSETHHPGSDVAALILRLTIGPMMIVHGMNKVRGPGGLEGTTKYFESLGLQPSAAAARAPLVPANAQKIVDDAVREAGKRGGETPARPQRAPRVRCHTGIFAPALAVSV